MIRKILQKDSELLRVKSQPVTNFQAAQLIIQDLLDTIADLKASYEFKRGVGLAAVQIGQPVRLSVIEIQGKPYILINPEILEISSEKLPIREGCLSFFEYRAQVRRFTYIKIKAQDEKGVEYELDAEGDSAMLLQHEIDHMNGILYFDHLPNKEKDLFPPQ